MTKTIKSEKQLKRTAVTIAIIEIAVIVVAAVMFVNINQNIRHNNDILSKYDTYIVGEKRFNINRFKPWIDDAGEIHEEIVAKYVYSYNYKGDYYEFTENIENYELPESHEYDDMAKYEVLNDIAKYECLNPKYEALKIKSDNPEQAVVASKYDNHDEKVARSVIIFFAVGFTITLIVIYAIEAKDMKKEIKRYLNKS